MTDTVTSTGTARFDDDVLALVEPVRRVAAARGAQPAAVDDVVQETLLRVMSRRQRLDTTALLPYALVVARNLVATDGRDAMRTRRNLPRLLDRSEPDRPEDVVLRREQERALVAALASLPPKDRSVLLDHELHGRDTVALAADSGATPGGVAARLARTRARLRVDYLLQLRKVQLPTDRCHRVLLALSSGERRQQEQVGAGRHLLSCRTCNDLSSPLLERRSALAGAAPWILLPTALLWHRLRDSHVAQAVTAGGVGAAVVAGVAVAGRNDTPPAPVRPAVSAAASTPASALSTPPAGPAASPVGNVYIGAHPLLPLTGGAGVLAGSLVQARDVRVLSVPADEGFWIGSDTARIWVQLRAANESGPRIRPGQRLTFTARLVRHPDDFAAAVGVTAAEGAAILTRQGVHLAVSPAGVRIR